MEIKSRPENCVELRNILGQVRDSKNVVVRSTVFRRDNSIVRHAPPYSFLLRKARVSIRFGKLIDGDGTQRTNVVVVIDGDRIREVIAAVPFVLTVEIERSLTVSVGVAAVAPGRHETDLKSVAERLLADADAALYRAKALGRNRVQIGTG